MKQPQNQGTIAEKVKSGEYFREARAMYDVAVHDPMAERYLYIFITLVGMILFVTAYVAAEGLYPLAPQVPFIFSTNDIVEDMPHIKSLLAYKGENPNEALMRFLARNYVMLREEYSIDDFDRDVNGIKSQTADDAFNEFQKFIDPLNPESPVTLYQRHSKRTIEVVSVKKSAAPDANSYAMQVVFDALVESSADIKKTRWQADIAFQYTGIALDDKTNKVKPFTFMVTHYRSQRLQDFE